MDILVFKIDERQFGLHADVVSEVVRAVTPTPATIARESILGMINLRGRLVPVIDTRSLLEMTTREVHHTDHLILVHVGDLLCAIHADRAIDLSALGDDPDLPTGSAAHGRMVECDLGFVQMIDVTELLGQEAISTLATMLHSQPSAELS